MHSLGTKPHTHNRKARSTSRIVSDNVFALAFPIGRMMKLYESPQQQDELINPGQLGVWLVVLDSLMVILPKLSTICAPPSAHLAHAGKGQLCRPASFRSCPSFRKVYALLTCKLQYQNSEAKLARTHCQHVGSIRDHTASTSRAAMQGDSSESAGCGMHQGLHLGLG